MNQNEFAVFIADAIKEMKTNQYYSFYDIARIFYECKDNFNEREIRAFAEYHLMLSDTEFDIIYPDELHYEHYMERSTVVYKLVFCWNCDYFIDQPFVTVEIIN
jgi:hypothetical protein